MHTAVPIVPHCAGSVPVPWVLRDALCELLIRGIIRSWTAYPAYVYSIACRLLPVTALDIRLCCALCVRGIVQGVAGRLRALTWDPDFFYLG